jgi:multidrug resistance efflux pump
MSGKPALLELPKKPPPGGAGDPARLEADESVCGVGNPARPEADESDCPAGGGFTRFVRRLFRILGALLVAAMGGFLISQHLLPPLVPAGEAAPAVPRVPAPKGKPKLIVCFGYADLEGGIMTLHPSQPGRVDEILVKENDTVPAGAALLRLNDRAARLRVEEAKAILDEATARLAQAEKGPELHRLKIGQQQAVVQTARYRLDASRHTLRARQERLKGETMGRSRPDPSTVEGVASTVQRVKEFEEVVREEEKKLAALELEDPAVELGRVQAEVATMRARLLQAEQVLEEHTLRAPKAGKVLRIFVTPGELLGAQPKKMAIQFCPDRPRVVRAEVDQAFALRVEVGQPALVEDDCSSESTWRGRVIRISDWYTERRQIAEEHLQLKDVRTLECLISLDPGQPPLRIGQRVRVTINRAEP